MDIYENYQRRRSSLQRISRSNTVNDRDAETNTVSPRQGRTENTEQQKKRKLCDVPLLCVYLTFHIGIILISIATCFTFKAIGLVVLAVVPALSMLVYVTHFSCTKFIDNPCTHSIIKRKLNWTVAIIVFLLGFGIAIAFQLNLTKLQTLIKENTPIQDKSVLSMLCVAVKEVCKLWLISITLPMKNIWNLGKNINVRRASAYKSAKSLLIVCVAVYGGVGIALGQTIGRIIGDRGAKQDENFVGAVRRTLNEGLFDATFECITMTIAAMLLYQWMSRYYVHFGKDSEASRARFIGLFVWYLIGNVLVLILPIAMSIGYHHYLPQYLESFQYDKASQYLLELLAKIVIIAWVFSVLIYILHRQYRVIQTQDLQFITTQRKYEPESTLDVDYTRQRSPSAPDLSLPSVSSELEHKMGQLSREESHNDAVVEESFESDQDVIVGMNVTPMGPSPSVESTDKSYDE